MSALPEPLDAPHAAGLGPPAGLALFGACWGLTLPLTKFATSTGHHPFGMLTWQLGVGAALLGALCAYRRIRVPLDARHLRWYALVAALGTLVPNTFSLMTYPHLPAGIMALLVATVPLLTLALAIALGAEPPDPRRLGGIGLGVAALALVALPEAGLPSRDALPWLAVGLIAPLCYAVEGNAVASRAPPALSPVAALFGASALGCAVAALAASLVDGHVDPYAPWTRVEAALAASAVGNTVAYAGYLWLLGRAGAVFSSQVAYVVTVTGVAGGIVFLGERLAWPVLLAVPLMLAGVALVRPRGGGEAADGRSGRASRASRAREHDAAREP